MNNGSFPGGSDDHELWTRFWSWLVGTDLDKG